MDSERHAGKQTGWPPLVGMEKVEEIKVDWKAVRRDLIAYIGDTEMLEPSGILVLGDGITFITKSNAR